MNLSFSIRSLKPGARPMRTLYQIHCRGGKKRIPTFCSVFHHLFHSQTASAKVSPMRSAPACSNGGAGHRETSTKPFSWHPSLTQLWRWRSTPDEHRCTASHHVQLKLICAVVHSSHVFSERHVGRAFITIAVCDRIRSVFSLTFWYSWIVYRRDAGKNLREKFSH